MNPYPGLAALALSLPAVSPLFAADTPAPTGVVNLVASASTEVAMDLMSVALTTTREGADASAVQSALKLALDAALNEARRAAKPGQLEVQTGNFSLYPRYTKQGLISGWQGTAELLIEGRDMSAIGQLAGRISSMTINRVGYGLSRGLREKSEAEVAAEAIAGYRAKAADYARHFGYAGYAIREVNVSGSAPPPEIMQRMRVQTMAAREDTALPVEAGKAVVTVNVAGTVQLTR